MNYTIDETNVVKIFLTDSKIPMIMQPHWPDGSEWTTTEATNWAKAYIKATEDPSAKLPGVSSEFPLLDRELAVAETNESTEEDNA